MAKAAASTPKRGKASTKTATTGTTTATTKTVATASSAKPRSRTPKRIAEAEPAAQTPPIPDQTLAQLATRLDAFEEKITTSLSGLHADQQVMKDLLHAVQQVQHTQHTQLAELTESVQHMQQTQLAQLTRHEQAEQAGEESQAEHSQTNGQEPSETFLPIVADLIRESLTEHLSPLTTALRRLEERVGFMSNRLKPGPGGQGGQQGGQDRQKPWRRDQRDQRDQRGDQQPPHFRSRGQGQGGGRQGQSQGQSQGQAWSPPSAASVQGHFAPRRFPSNGGDLQVGDDDE